MESGGAQRRFGPNGRRLANAFLLFGRSRKSSPMAFLAAEPQSASHVITVMTGSTHPEATWLCRLYHHVTAQQRRYAPLNRR